MVGARLPTLVVGGVLVPGYITHWTIRESYPWILQGKRPWRPLQEECSRRMERTIMLIVLFLVSHFNFLIVPCGGLSWLPVSFLLHVKYTLSYLSTPCDTSFKARRIEISLLTYLLTYRIVCVPTGSSRHVVVQTPSLPADFSWLVQTFHRHSSWNNDYTNVLYHTLYAS